MIYLFAIVMFVIGYITHAILFYNELIKVKKVLNNAVGLVNILSKERKIIDDLKKEANIRECD